MLPKIDFQNTVHEFEIMKLAVSLHMCKERGGAEVIAGARITQYKPKQDDGKIHFRLDYRTHSQSSSTLDNVASASFTSEEINEMLAKQRVKS